MIFQKDIGDGIFMDFHGGFNAISWGIERDGPMGFDWTQQDSNRGFSRGFSQGPSNQS